MISVTEHRPIGSCCAEVVESWYLEPAPTAEDEPLRRALQARLFGACGLPFLASPDSSEGFVRLSTRRDSSGALKSATFSLIRRGTKVTRSLGGVTVAPGSRASADEQTRILADELAQRIWKKRQCDRDWGFD